MFSGFLYHLRGYGLKVSMMEWLALMESLTAGYARSNLTVFYHLSREGRFNVDRSRPKRNFVAP